MNKSNIFSKISLGDITLKNRIVMASMTRGRVKNENLIPGEKQAIYYSQRASAGLIISEGTWVNEQAIGFMHVPGIYSTDQVEGWKKVTDAVHQNGGKIFCQLGHAGSLSHPEFQKGELPVGPSAVNINMQSFTSKGLVSTVTPRALLLQEIKNTIQDYKKAAQNALRAGFDGIEIHAQHPSLLSQFFSKTLNRRTDTYGGNLENRTRILFDIIKAISSIEGIQIGVKLNPRLNYGTMEHPDDVGKTYNYIIEKLNHFDISYLQILNRKEPGTDETSFLNGEVFEQFSPLFKGITMANGNLDFEKASAIIDNGQAELISFGTLFIANPDLPERFINESEFNEPDPATYFVGDDQGYISYPKLAS